MLNRRDVLAGSVAAMGLGVTAPVMGSETMTSVKKDWLFSSLETIDGHKVDCIGAPKLITSPWGPAVAFDGKDDGLFIDNHPMAGFEVFTFEAVFRPDGGAFEQRWFHLESGETPPVEPGKGNTRLLFEIRVVGDRWYLDAFMTGPNYREVMMVPEKTFPVGRWYHVAQTYDGHIYRSYVNGELQMECAMPFVPQGPGRSSVGVRMNKVAFFNGAVHRARFTNAALAPAQFLMLHDA